MYNWVDQKRRPFLVYKQKLEYKLVISFSLTDELYFMNPDFLAWLI